LFCQVCAIFKRFSPPGTLLLSFLFYLSFWGITNFIDPSFRNMLAASVSLCGLNYLIGRKFLRYCLVILVATLFHTSALFLLVVYFFVNKNWTNRQLIFTFILVNVITLFPNVIFNSLSFIFSSSDMIVSKIDNYTIGAEAETTGAGKAFSIGYLLHIFFFGAIIYCRNSIESLKNGKFLFNISILFPIVFRIGLVVLIFCRLQLYISFFYSIVVAYCTMCVVKKQRLYYMTFLFVVCLYVSTARVKSLIFVPYTNILMYLNKNYSFEYRSLYNYRNSPYKNVNN
jgi:hypothetical protein